MKKNLRIVITVIFVGLIWLGCPAFLIKNEFSKAQTSDDERQKLLERQKRIERDKSVPKEKIEKAYAEAKKIIDEISKVMAKRKPEFKLDNTYSSHLISTSEGQLGRTLDDISWQSKNARISIQVSLGFNKEEELIRFRKSMNRIAMGEFFAIPNVGDKAVLVKNVQFNTKNTEVGLHFVKGRAQVDIYVTNHKRKAEKNEKELMEVLALIEPLIIARPNFYD